MDGAANATSKPPPSSNDFLPDGSRTTPGERASSNNPFANTGDMFGRFIAKAVVFGGLVINVIWIVVIALLAVKAFNYFL